MGTGGVVIAISGAGEEERAVSEGEIMEESESEITPDIMDSESDKSEDTRHNTLLLGDKARAAAATGPTSAASLRASRERFGRGPGMV